MSNEHDYILERLLKKLSPDLHSRYRDTVFVLDRTLTKYRMLFPEYTDHSELHCMTVVDFCNTLVGEEQAKRLTPEEIFTLLMAGYLHDVGMGISMELFEEFKEFLPYEEYRREHPDEPISSFVRDYHHEFSGLFIRKYASLFEIETEELLFAIVQVARGHRKTDLFDPKEYPADYKAANGNRICLPYLAALIRMADEIDVVASRNPILLYDLEALTDEIQIFENRKLNAVQALITVDSGFTMVAHTDDPVVYEGLQKVRDKMQRTLDYCRTVTEERTPFRITQKTVTLIKSEKENANA